MGCCVSNEKPKSSDVNVQEKEIDLLEYLPKVPTFDLKVKEPKAPDTCMSDTEIEEIMSLEKQLKTLLGHVKS